MSEFGSQITFMKLYDLHQRVQVPMIQRDYAQGRESEEEIRDEFLDALHAALILPEENESLPLNLDFIYGSVEGEGETRFLPLDGQQRLTTLFLLHWYLAWRDGCWDMFKVTFCPEGYARFSYKVRPSSTEFFNALVEFMPTVAPESVKLVSEMLIDQPWYFRNWRLDPTIQSSLTMLDAIHDRFKDTKGLFDRIMSVEQPAITFQLLDLENFGLSDDLYIKMNARGKPLTPFEHFKARFEQVLEGLFSEETRKIVNQDFPIAKFFSQRMDTRWADFFWPHRNPETNIFDEALMNLFRTVVMITRSPENETFIDDITLLRNSRLKSDYSLFHRRGWLDRSFAEMLIVLLEVWSEGGDRLAIQLPDTRYFNEDTVFSKAVTKPENFDYVEIVQLLGYALFLKENEGNINPQEFQEWMRVVFNLSVNTEYNRPGDLHRSFAGLITLSSSMNNILQYLANTEKPLTGFNQQQIAEERLKAQLIIHRPDWRSLIDQAEGHPYFRGQIDFLFDFSGALALSEVTNVMDWKDVEHLQGKPLFRDCLEKAEAMFTNIGLKPLPDFRWERALLCIGNYLLPRGSNYSFLVNPQTDPTSWKRLIRDKGQRRDMLGQLWKRLDSTDNLAANLDALIAETGGLEPWREAFVRTPTAIRYCIRRFIRWISADEVYLLQTTQMNGTHAELFTYCLYENLRPDEGRLKPLVLSYSFSINTDYYPRLILYFFYENNWLPFEVEYHSGRYILSIEPEKVSPYPEIEEKLHEELGFNKNAVHYFKHLTPDIIKSSIFELSEKLATIQGPEKNKDRSTHV